MVLDVDETATNINFGAILTGDGTVWADDLRFELRDPAPPVPDVLVRGQVTDADGQPVASASVALIRPGELRATTQIETDATGSYSATLRPGRYAVTANVPGRYAAYVAPQEISGTEAELPVARLASEGFTLSGRMTDDSGEPVAGLELALHRYSEEPGDIFYTRTDDAGNYAIGLPKSLAYVLTSDTDAYTVPQERLAGMADQTLDLELVRNGPAPDSLVQWIRKQAVPLAAVTAESGFKDMQPLKEMIGDARIVALGEATHGTREFFQLKHRMLEFLVEEMGFTVFAIEANWPESLAINDYVLHGKGDAREALAGIYFWTWNTKEVLEMIEWMRRHNQNPDNEQKVKFFGYDMQYLGPALQRVKEYLVQVDEGVSAEVEAQFASLGNEPTVQQVMKLKEEEQKPLLAAARELPKRFERNRDVWTAATDEQQFILAHQHATIVRQAGELLATKGLGQFNSRDAAMAANLRWILDQEPPGTKVVSWAHNGHISEAADRMIPMGSHLHRMYGEDYVTFGFAFNRGGFQAQDRTGKGRGLNAFTVGPAPENNIGAAFARTGLSAFVLDLRELPEQGNGAGWMRTTRPMRQIGAVYFDEPSMSAPIVLPESFDAVIFVDETNRAVPVHMEEDG